MINEIKEAYNEINKIFNEKLKSRVDAMEKERVSKTVLVKRLNIASGILIGLSILFILFAFFPIVPVLALLSIFSTIFIPLGLILAIAAQVIKFKFVSSIKKEMFPYVFKAIGPDLRYYPGKIKIIPEWAKGMTVGNINLNLIQELINMFLPKQKQLNIGNIGEYGILPPHAILSQDDAIDGTYNDRPVEIVEFELMDYNRHYGGSGYASGGSSNNLVKVFQGVLFKTTMDKPFKSRVIIRQRGAAYCRIDKMQKVTLESGEFNNIYDVYAEDQVEARYLLTTSMMDRLINIYKCGQNINLSVVNNDIAVVKQTKKDMFEPDIAKPLNDVNSYYEVMMQTKSILDFITELKLDVNVGL